MTAPQRLFQIETLDGHDRSAFASGVEPLDRYLKQQASQDARKKVAIPFLLVTHDRRIAGYYTLSSADISAEDIPAQLVKKLRLPRYPELPATRIGRLAVDRNFRGQRLGELLLMDALKRSWLASLKVASLAVIVDAKNDEARNFYPRYEFLPLPANPNHLFLPISTIETLFTL